MLAIAAFDGATVGRFIISVCEVYVGLILLYIVLTMALGFGWRPPYFRAFDVLIQFLREVCDPYLGLFRRFIHPIGGIDLSPLFAIIVLGIVEQLVVGVLGG